MTPLEQFDREGWEEELMGICNSWIGPDERAYAYVRLKDLIAQERTIAAREAVEERVRMIREEMEGVQVPYEEGKGEDWYLAASRERNQILQLPSLNLPASDSDTN